MVNRRFRKRGNEGAPDDRPEERAEHEPDLGYDQDVDMHSPGDGYHHDRSSHKQAHPGFKNVQSSIAKREGISKDRAGAILAASSRHASAHAKAANPRLKRVKGK